MASGLIPVLIKFVRDGNVAFVQNKQQWMLSITTILFTLYFSIQTTFVLDDNVADTLAATALPWLLLSLHIFVPISVALFKVMVEAYKKHVLLGLIVTMLFGGHVLGLLFFPLIKALIMGTLGSSLLIVLTYGEVAYNMSHRKRRVFIKFFQTLAILFIASFVAFFVDWLLGHSNQYQLVAEYVQNNLPSYIRISTEAPMTVHYFVWQGAVMVILYNIFDLLKLRKSNMEERNIY